VSLRCLLVLIVNILTICQPTWAAFCNDIPGREACNYTTEEKEIIQPLSGPSGYSKEIAIQKMVTMIEKFQVQLKTPYPPRNLNNISGDLGSNIKALLREVHQLVGDNFNTYTSFLPMPEVFLYKIMDLNSTMPNSGVLRLGYGANELSLEIYINSLMLNLLDEQPSYMPPGVQQIPSQAATGT